MLEGNQEESKAEDVRFLPVNYDLNVALKRDFEIWRVQENSSGHVSLNKILPLLSSLVKSECNNCRFCLSLPVHSESKIDVDRPRALHGIDNEMIDLTIEKRVRQSRK